MTNMILTCLEMKLFKYIYIMYYICIVYIYTTESLYFI